MTAFNTDYKNTELLDQELTIEELEAVAGGKKAGPPRARKTGWVRTGEELCEVVRGATERGVWLEVAGGPPGAGLGYAWREGSRS